MITEDRDTPMDSREREVRLLFQIRWIVRFAVANILGSVVLLLVLRGLLDQELGLSYSRAFYVMRNVQKFLFPIVGFSMLFYILVVSAMVTLITLFVSHSIAGPLFRLERFAEALGRGDLTVSTHLRKGDQVRGLAAEVGRLKEELAAGLRPAGENFIRIDRLWDEYDRAVRSGTGQGAVLNRIAEELEALSAGLGPPPH